MKYYIKSLFGNYFSNTLIFNTTYVDVMEFNTKEEAKESIELYHLDNCIVKTVGTL